MKEIKILMIDDNKNLVNMIGEYFKDHQTIHLVDVAYDGKEGFDKIKENKDAYDVILLDLIMPNKDGMYVLEEMKKNDIHKNVIVETSYNASETIRQVSEYGVNYFLLKPFDLKDLEKRIMNFCIDKTLESKNIDF